MTQTFDYECLSVKTNGTIKAAIETYEKLGVSPKQLLTDYNAILTNPEELDEAVNPWQSHHTKKGVEVVCGVSDMESAFDVAAMSLHKQKPIAVIKSIYYRNKNRNDSALEKVFLELYIDKISSKKHILVMNPSPYVVEYIEKNRGNTNYVVIDKTMAGLYSKQYKHSTFLTTDNLSSVKNTDVLVVLTNNVEEQMLTAMLDSIGSIKAGELYCILRSRLINNKSSLLWRSLLKANYKLQEIILVPNEVTNSIPRKKSIVYADDSMKKELTIRRMEYNSSEKSVSISDRSVIISQEELLGNKTLNTLWKEAFAEKKEKETEYRTARVYAFSKEIPVLYSMYYESTGCYAKAYYASTKNPYLPSIRGKALTKRIRKGLYAKTVDEVIALLETLPYSRLMSEAIAIDIRDSYFNKGISVTLKTLWFCLRDVLKNNTSYDDAMMIDLFSNNHTISNLYPDKDSGDEFKRAIEEQLEEGEEVKVLKLLKMLNMVITEAIKRGYLTENRILPLIPAAQNRATKRQAEVRQALTKRSFEDVEERKIMEYLVPFYTKSSIILAVVIRLMTGISIRETCGLLWRDFQYDKTLNIFRLSITKFVDSNAKIIHHVMHDNWEKYRVLPISFLLGEMIMARKKYLNKEGLDDKVLEDYPIILPREDLSRIRKGYRPIYCKPSSVAEKCRKAINVAEVPRLQVVLPDKEGNEIETDLNIYNGDIFRTNFRDKALNVAGFGLDELNYYLGLKRPDTFSQHYCDYTNQYVQLQMARKLDRWAERYEFGIKTKCGEMSAAKTIRGTGDGVPCAEIEIEKNDAENESITIQVESMHGFNISVTSY